MRVEGLLFLKREEKYREKRFYHLHQNARNSPVAV
jgi:hypothetical protein